MSRLYIVIALLMISSCRKSETPPPPPASPPAVPAGFERQGTPKPGEWLYRFKEEGQTFEQYQASCANRLTLERPVFYIQPLGDAGEKYGPTLALMWEYGEAFFGVQARILEPIPMFENGYVPQRRQHNSTMIIGQLAERAPKDALVYIGITGEDLFAKGLHFVFGEGSLVNRCGVYSLHRYATEDEALFKRRALKLMAHEVGHILSIEHCIHYKCVMQGANSLAEDDRHPMHLCPVDLEKLKWNMGFDARERYRTLQAFYRKAGLEAEAAWAAERLREAGSP
jgi:archaemetzincin